MERFLEVYLPTKGLKRSTLLDYNNTLRSHAVPILGNRTLTELEQQPELLDGYLTEIATTKKLSAKTRANHVSTLHRVFEVARRWRLIGSNPVDVIEKPRVEPPDTVVLDEADVARYLAAYRDLEQADREDVWLPVVPRMVLVGLGTALRRGELQGLRWGDVELLEGLLRVRQQFTRGAFSTPKSATALVDAARYVGDRTMQGAGIYRMTQLVAACTEIEYELITEPSEYPGPKSERWLVATASKATFHHSQTERTTSCFSTSSRRRSRISVTTSRKSFRLSLGWLS